MISYRRDTPASFDPAPLWESARSGRVPRESSDAGDDLAKEGPCQVGFGKTEDEDEVPGMQACPFFVVNRVNLSLPGVCLPPYRAALVLFGVAFAEVACGAAREHPVNPVNYVRAHVVMAGDM